MDISGVTNQVNEALPIIQHNLKLFFLLILLSAAISYIAFIFTGHKYMLPGDFYSIKAPRRIYIPFGSTLIITSLIFIIIKTKIWFFLISVLGLYIVYKAVYKREL